MTNAELLTELRENFRKEMAKFFYLAGDDETFQDVNTESHERLIMDAYSFATKYFEKENAYLEKLKEKNETNNNHN